MVMRYLGQREAQLVDEHLMSSRYGFSIDQLMELAGLSVACAVSKEFPSRRNVQQQQQASVTTFDNVLVVAGPGNNGGDALVAARHLKHFGYAPQILYPKKSSKPLFQGLVTQCEQLRIPILDGITSKDDIDAKFDLIVDGIFGFSFEGSIRVPFDTIIAQLKKSHRPIVSIDIPSGWHVEKGNVDGVGLEPKMLVSLTTPKLCAQHFAGPDKIHYVGGRFVPPELAEEFKLELPDYPGIEQCGDASTVTTMALKALSLQEKLAYFYCSYVREEPVDRDTDSEAVRRWEKIKVSKRKSRERMCLLLAQYENTSAAHVRNLDTTYRAKREMLLLVEGTIGCAVSGSGSSSKNPALTQLEVAKLNSEMLQDCGALSIVTQGFLRSVHGFLNLNFQHMDLDKLNTMIEEFHHDMVLLYMLILFNANKQNPVFDRQLYLLGTSTPTYGLVAIMDCLNQMNALPGFPIKRLLMVFYEWFEAVMGDITMLEKLKNLRRLHNGTDPAVLADEANGLHRCKSFNTYHDQVFLDPQDPYVLQKLKFVKVREGIHNKYLHKPHAELKTKESPETDLASAGLEKLDDEWDIRCETMYRLFLPRMREFTAFLGNLVTISCGSALNARDKKTFYSRRPSTEQGGYGTPMGENDHQYWKWVLREKTIVLDVSNLLVLLIFKHFRSSHVCKGEYFMHFFLEANLLATLTKFMNKDLTAYLQVSRQESDESKTGFYALEYEIDKLTLRAEEDMNEFEMQSTRIMTSILRILQKLSKRKPNIIKNALCRSSSIVWLKRVVSLKVPVPRLYALKLVKSQAKYLGHQWLRKYTCINLLTEVYLYVRPELDDGWLHYEDEDLNKQPSQDSVERLIFGEVQAYHHKNYWGDTLSASKPTSMICESAKELGENSFDADGGRVVRFFNDLKLDPVHFCQQYEKWLDQEGLQTDPHARTVPLPIAF
ncbi:TPA: hypothetical protein N0F65_002911 [Lagenidium giganteum]|uniref:NAD(P)H-hydrate epimerase n=1 Tax=Lagenidium giganteum TaxID=4803 RepID=A0AAV2Z7Q0_9STRA|nr:TPA: hypothetical protein N0F65_002911 [Lagenidium giganteum]